MTAGAAASHPAERGMRSTRYGIILNLVLAGVKVFTGYVGNSYALIADGIESSLDVVSSSIVYVGLRIARRPPDSNHPYGHGKAEPIAALVVCLALLAAAFGIAVESVNEILTPHHAPAPFTLIVLAVVVFAKEGLFRYVFRVARELESTSVHADAWHHRSDALTSAFAFAGISVALVGGEGWESADDWAALAASAVIVFNAYRLVVPALAELTDAVPQTNLELSVMSIAQSVDGVLGVEKVLIRKMGFEYYLDLHVEVEGDITVREGHRIAHRVKDALRHAIPSIAGVLVHIEPAGEH